MAMLLQGRVALISGAASARGIGLTTARLFAREGARVAILDIDGAAAAKAAAELGTGHLGLACDVTDRAACVAAVNAALAAFGKVDILVNNAGITQPLKVMDISAKNFTDVVNVNLAGTLNLSQAAIPHMRTQRSGAIVCMSSVSAQRGGGVFGGPHYAAAKAGVLGLAKAMARELGPDNIRVNSIAPGLIDTDITQGKIVGDLRDKVLEGIPLGRIGVTGDVAGVCLFLASDLSAYVTGATIDVNGGMLIH